jgi:hypothetical protein
MFAKLAQIAIVRLAVRRLPIPIASGRHSLSATGSKHRRPAPLNASGNRSQRPQPTNSRRSVCANGFAGCLTLAPRPGDLSGAQQLEPERTQWTNTLVVPLWRARAMAGTPVGVATRTRQRQFISARAAETLSVWFASAPK